ncbi:cell division protein FtsA [Acetobacter oeni]|uniref:Cell division protein FtsA n=1 Tax=Acetobacter oeni TaxID=304077 RepID=A0A511XHZ7_9PROT|nr:cell division protein FtsA [Acetobacter oeni]MBB3882522.1 cell division protein FtsA [Acetobacter oeni]NHO18666.1 cell division protein FtsA [Acetobacter oeni]GBR11848.1 cell division protein FtsA [Acetobacter oeni LMG 21952]GEN62541.1 cell division protein FtsA [Acetobacter oeni]
MKDLVVTGTPSSLSTAAASLTGRERRLRITGRNHGEPPETRPEPRVWRNRIVGVLDIGSTKITCLIGKGEPNGTLKVLGHGWLRSSGVKNGAVVDLKAAEAIIRHVVGNAEREAGVPLNKVIVNLSCGQPESRLFNVHWPIGGREITDSDIRRIVTEGRIKAQAGGRAVIHTLPLDFAVDETDGVTDPRGHLCDQLRARLHVIDASATALRTLDSLLSRAELQLDGVVSAPLASGLAVTDADQRMVGTTVVDMGGGTTSLAVFAEGQLLHTAQINIGGEHVTRDIARGLGTSTDNAERLKTMHGHADLSGDTDDGVTIRIERAGSDAPSFEAIPRAVLGDIIRPRIEETFELVRDRLDGAGLGRLAGGRVILTGGASMLDGVGSVAARVLNRPVRLGRPGGVTGLPEQCAAAGFATTAGLLAWAASAERPFGDIEFAEEPPRGVLNKLVSFIRARV